MDTIKNLNPLIDMDPFSYSCGFAADSQIKKEGKEKGWTPEQIENEIATRDYVANALSNVKTAVEFILEQAFPEHDYYKAYLTGKDNFRNEVGTILPYKGNRDPSHKPKYFKEIREYIANKYDAEIVEGQEADDAMGIYQFSRPDKSTVICSIDKDMKMIPGYHYIPTTGNFFYQSMDEANEFFLWQMMVGDRVDNIPGIAGIGPVKATKILTGAGSLEEGRRAVESLYAEQYGPNWKQAFDEVAQLLWIRRKEGEGPNV
jgi:DNA polymerase-1